MLIQKLSDAPSPPAGAFGDVVISPPAHAPAQPVPPPPRAVEPTLLQVQTAVEQANKMLRSLAATLEFEIDPDTHTTVVRLIDNSDHKVLRQVPSQEMLEIARALGRVQGLLVRHEA